MKTRILIVLATLMFIPGCFASNSTSSGIISSSTAAATAAIGTAVGGPVVGAVVGVVTGVATDAAIDEGESTTEVLESLPVEERASALKAQFFWESIEKLGMWAIAAVFGFFMLPLLIGYFIPTRRQRKLERMAFDHPEITSESMK